MGTSYVNDIVDSVSVAENVNVAKAYQITKADVVSLAEFKAGKVADPGINKFDAISITEIVSQLKQTLVMYDTSVLTLHLIGQVDWLWTDTFPGNRMGIKVFAVVVMAAAADTFVLRSGSVTGPIWFRSVTTGAATQVYPLGGALVRPVMKASDQTVDAASRYALFFEKP